MSGQSPRSGGGTTWALVPFKGRSRGKQRLAPVLDGDQRGVLAAAMLTDVLAALSTSGVFDRVLVVRGEDDPHPDGLERVTWLVQPGPAPAVAPVGGLNRALGWAQGLTANEEVRRLVIVLADVPLIQADDVAALLDAAPPGPGPFAVLAPDGASTGTNALVLSPPDVLEPRFGADSFRGHLARLGERRVPYAIVRRSNLALDLDTPEDLERFLEVAPPNHTRAVLESFGMSKGAPGLPLNGGALDVALAPPSPGG